MLQLSLPASQQDIDQLKAGDRVRLSGSIFTARDAVHRRLCQALSRGERLPVDLDGQTIYYMGPSPASPGRVIGSCGPTTSRRMDAYTPALLSRGLKVTIGKGERSETVIQEMRQHRALYLVTYGGAGSYLAKCIKAAEVVAFPELGAEALMLLEIADFPAVVAYDAHGGDLFRQEISRYARLTG